MARLNDLSLKMNYEVIKTSEGEPKIGVRKLAELFQCDKNQVSTILKNKKELKSSMSRTLAMFCVKHVKDIEPLNMLTSMMPCFSGIKCV